MPGGSGALRAAPPVRLRTAASAPEAAPLREATRPGGVAACGEAVEALGVPVVFMQFSLSS